MSPKFSKLAKGGPELSNIGAVSHFLQLFTMTAALDSLSAMTGQTQTDRDGREMRGGGGARVS